MTVSAIALASGAVSGWLLLGQNIGVSGILGVMLAGAAIAGLGILEILGKGEKAQLAKAASERTVD